MSLKEYKILTEVEEANMAASEEFNAKKE